MPSYEEADKARRELARALRTLPGFAGVGLVANKGRFSLKVNFQDELSDEVPRDWYGMPVAVDIVGRSSAY